MIVHNGNIVVNNGRWIIPPKPPEPDPYNPLNLPPYTIRVKFKQGASPSSYKSGGTWNVVSSDDNIWDFTYENADWSYLFHQRYNLIEVLGANSTGVTNMTNIFYRDSDLTKVALFDTSSVVTMERMFRGTGINKVELYDTGNVRNMNEMLLDCRNLTEIPLFDTHNATNMSSAFYGCSNITTVPLFNTSNVTNMSYMFQECTSLQIVPLFDTSKVTNMSQMFIRCSSLLSSPIFNTSNVTTMRYMFGYCTSLQYVPLYNTSKLSDMLGMFDECYNVKSGALSLYQQVISQTTPPSSHQGTFHNCGSNTTTGAAELAQIPSSWKSWD